MRSIGLFAGVVGLCLSVFSCGGEEFGSVDDDAEAGATSLGNGGSGDGTSGSNTGGSKIDPGDGGTPGVDPSGGTGSDLGGMPGVAGTLIGTGGIPDLPSCDQLPPELPGDCHKVKCEAGVLSSEVDQSDTPEPRGVCDVPECDDNGEPYYESDPSQCAINQKCHEGTCHCAGCPNGTVPALSNDLCRMPGMTAASASVTLTGSAAANAIDGNAENTWNSGKPYGVLVLTPASPQPMTAIAMWLTGSAENNVPTNQRYISVHVSIETDSGNVAKAGNFSFTDSPTGPLRLDFGLVNAKKVTLTFESPASWIAVHEVIFEACAQEL